MSVIPHWFQYLFMGVFSTREWIARKQEPHLINLYILSYYHWPCTHPRFESIWWMNPRLSWIPTVMGSHNIARQQADFDHVPRVKPRLIVLPSLLSYLPLYPLHPLIPLRKNTSFDLITRMQPTSFRNKLFSWKILLIIPSVT